jgi:hypothetical protein
MDAGRIDGDGKEKCEKLTEVCRVSRVLGLAELKAALPTLCIFSCSFVYVRGSSPGVRRRKGLSEVTADHTKRHEQMESNNRIHFPPSHEILSGKSFREAKNGKKS